jgi:glycerophosphoryl diester phosphodiesterase
MLIIGHRGAAGLAPENTVSSFKKAEENGAAWLECDVRQTKDGQLVLNHDANLKRTHGIKVRIKALKLSELQKLTRQLGKRIPTLNELLAVANVSINLDLKEHGLEKKVLDAIKKFPHKVLITSWNPQVLKKIRALDRNIRIGPVLGHKWKVFLPIIPLLKRLNIYSITIGSKLVTLQRVRRFKKLGWKVFAFTVNEPEEFDRLRDLGVDGVFTDYPNILSKLA